MCAILRSRTVLSWRRRTHSVGYCTEYGVQRGSYWRPPASSERHNSLIKPYLDVYPFLTKGELCEVRVLCLHLLDQTWSRFQTARLPFHFPEDIAALELPLSPLCRVSLTCSLSLNRLEANLQHWWVGESKQDDFFSCLWKTSKPHDANKSNLQSESKHSLQTVCLIWVKV